MTFAEIAAVEGISTKRAQQVFNRAIRKLTRKQWNALLVLQEMANELQKNRYAYLEARERTKW